MRKKKLQTFPRYLEVECWKKPDLRSLEPVLQAVAEACKQINRIVQRAQTDDVYGVAVDANGKPLEENVQGESQQILDVLCNTIMLRAFCGSGRDIHSVASEEEDDPRCCADVMVRAAGSGFGWVLRRKDLFLLLINSVIVTKNRTTLLLLVAIFWQPLTRLMVPKTLTPVFLLEQSLGSIANHMEQTMSTRNPFFRMADRWLLLVTVCIRKCS